MFGRRCVVMMVMVMVMVMTFGVPSDTSELLLKKYTHMKVMSGCVGQATVLRWRSQLRRASVKCQADDPLDITPDFTFVMDDLRKMLHRPQLLLPLSQFPQSQYQFPQSQYQFPQHLQQFLQGSQYPQFNLLSQYNHPMSPLYGLPQLYNPLHQLTGYRTKRQTDLDPDKLNALRNEITAKISNITCVLREMKMLDSENQPNYSYVSQEIVNLPVSEALKGELREAVDTCRDFSRCLPEGRAKEPLSRELGAAISFMKCLNLRQVLVCMRDDLRKFASTSDLPDLMLPGLTSHLSLQPKPLASQVEDLLFGDTDPLMLML